MKNISRKAQSIWAKKSTDGSMLWLPLVTHLADSAAIAQKLWNCWLSDGLKRTIASGVADEDCTERLLLFLAAAHDIGKATPVFQAKPARPPCPELDEHIRENLTLAGLPMKPYRNFAHPEKTPHALATQFLLMYVGCNRNAAVVVGAHHGKPPDNNTLNSCGIGSYAENFYLEKIGEEPWSAVQRELIAFALSLAGFATIDDLPAPNMATQALLSGLVIMTDWIASNETYFPYYHLEDTPEYAHAHTRAKAAWEELALTRPWNAGNAWMHTNLYRERFSFTTPNTIQSAVVQTAAGIDTPGILVLEAPMGSGKTEAALATVEIFADKAKRTGLFFALPTQATSDGIFPRILKWMEELDPNEKLSVRLAHGKAQFNKDYQTLKLFSGSSNVEEDEDAALVVHGWFGGRKRSMLVDFVVGTIDQLLLAALKQKHVMLRHLGLANKVVVIDECHAYDAYMNRYLMMALQWLGAYRVPVIVLSATLPARKRQAVIHAYMGSNSTPEPVSDPLGRSTYVPCQPQAWISSREYPLITCTDGNEVKQCAIPVYGIPREVRLDYLTDDVLVDRLDDLLSDGGCAGVIVNTVDRAQEKAKALNERFGEETVWLLHSRFLAPDRAQKEIELLKELGKPGKNNRRPPRRIVVGTQVLEQSLDIDFDVLATDICPMDLLLQRIGRLHRHERARPEKLSEALCLITGLNGNDFEPGARAVYDEYLLMRTKALLPPWITLPQGISDLVQDAYDETLDITPEPPGYQEAKERWKKAISDKEKSAEDFRICPPWPGPAMNLVGWLNTDVPASDKHGEAAVRDADESIEVLLVQERDGGRLCFLPWIEKGREIPQNETPCDELARTLACQSIRLPRALCAPWKICKTIDVLETLNGEQLSKWQESPWLKGELFLILDENYSKNLCGYRLKYNENYGLLCEKEGETDAR